MSSVKWKEYHEAEEKYGRGSFKAKWEQKL